MLGKGRSMWLWRAAQNSSIASYGLGSAVSTLLYGVTATDGATLIAVGVDPMVALRQE
jgi:hypothetical protein